MPTNKQSGMLQLTGATQKMTFYKKKNGEFALKRKGGLTPEKFASNPKYDRMRKQNLEFTTACKAASLLKRAFDPVLPRHALVYAYQRLMTKCREVIQSDTLHDPGYRQVIDGDASLFRSFEFTSDGKFASVLYAQPAFAFDRPTGNVTLTLPATEAVKLLKPPGKATHCRLTLSVVAADFAEEQFELSFTESADIALSAGLTEPLVLTTGVAANSARAVFTALSIQFFHTEGDEVTPAGSDRFNLMRMIAADFPA